MGPCVSASRPAAAGVLHRPADHASAGPAPTPSPPTATPSGCCSASPQQRTGKRPAKLELADLDAVADRRVPRPPRTRASQQRAHPQRPPRRDPLPVPLTPRCATQSTPRSSSESSPSRRSASTGPSSRSSPPRGRRPPGRPDRTTWIGRRDHALLLVAVQTGLRVSELIGLRLRATSSSAPAPTSTATARAASNAAPR